MSDEQRTRDMLKTVFGFDEFRPGQQQVIQRLLEGRSALAIFPTGAGKSICYQLPALMMEGLTLVISPLIALMKDQIDFLLEKGVPAARLDSTQEWEEARQVQHDLHTGKLKLLYVSPERLGSERFLQSLKRLKIAMLAIDEAHCISEWGHNFRPDYMRLANIARQIGVKRVLCLTATATPSVAKDIAKAFAIADGDIIHTGFHRPNLHLHVTPAPLEHRRALLLERIRSRLRGPTIVYVTLQRTAEDVADFLAHVGLPARAYHAGMDAGPRSEVQDWFMLSADAIVVATIAFGMGIDKPDIRYVFHYNLPKSLESYAQEIGRAGRDGQPSICEMLPSLEDTIALENFVYGDTPTAQAAGALVDDVFSRGETFDVSAYELGGEYDIRPIVVETMLTYLELEGFIELTGPFYNEYKFQPLRPSKDILARFDEHRADFLRKIFAQAQKARTWFTLDIAQIAASLDEPRGRIVTAINYLEEQGDLVLQVAGWRQGYRRKKSPQEMPALKKSMAEKFVAREKRDIARLAEVLRFAEHAGCKTRYLLGYFGEKLEADCGHCAWCDGQRPPPIPAAPPRKLGQSEINLLGMLRAEGHEGAGGTTATGAISLRHQLTEGHPRQTDEAWLVRNAGRCAVPGCAGVRGAARGRNLKFPQSMLV